MENVAELIKICKKCDRPFKLPFKGSTQEYHKECLPKGKETDAPPGFADFLGDILKENE